MIIKTNKAKHSGRKCIKERRRDDLVLVTVFFEAVTVSFLFVAFELFFVYFFDKTG
jgi:hypothetical protein